MSLAFKLLKTKCKIGDRVRISNSVGVFEGIILEFDETEIALTLDDNSIFTTIGDDIKSFLSVSSLPIVEQKTEKSIPSSPAEATSTVSQTLFTSDFKQEDIKTTEAVSNEHLKPRPDTTTLVEDKSTTESASSPIAESKSEGMKTIVSVGRNLSKDELLYIDWKVRGNQNKIYTLLKDGFKCLGDYTKKEENLLKLPVRGRFANNINGFIINQQTGQKVFYDNSVYVPVEVASTNSGLFYIPNQNGHAADLVIPAVKLCNVIDYLKNLVEKEKLGSNPKHLLNIINSLIGQFPQNESLQNLKSYVEKALYSFRISQSVKSNSLPVKQGFNKKAKELQLKKQYEKAIGYFIEAINHGEKVESSIKDAAATFGSMYKQARGDENERTKVHQQAVLFMNNHRGKLHDDVSTWYFLENFYYSVHDFDHFFEVLDKLMNVTEVKSNHTKSSAYLNKRASAFIEMKDYDNARQCIEESLKIYHDNVGSLKLKDTLDELVKLSTQLQTASGEKAEDIKEQIEAATIKASDFSRMSSAGLTKFITESLDEHTELIGVSEKAKGDTDDALKSIRGLISRTGINRPKEYARYLLTEAKLLQGMPPADDKISIYGILSTYCVAMARVCMTETPLPDVIRFYLNQAFAIEQNENHSDDRDIAQYLYTLSNSSGELLQKTLQQEKLQPKTIQQEIKSLLKDILSAGNRNAHQWEAILPMLFYNKDVAAKIVNSLYEDSQLRRLSIDCLVKFGIELNDKAPIEEFRKQWEKASEMRLGSYQRIISQLSSFGADSRHVEDVSMNLDKMIQECRDETWLSVLDQTRLGSIQIVLIPAIRRYLQSNGYQNKFISYGSVKGQLTPLITEIKSQPTKISYEGLLPLLKRIMELIDDSFENVKLTSEPRITISLLSDETGVEGNIVSLQLAVDNDINSSPVSNIRISIANSNGVYFNTNENTTTSDGALEGGSRCTFKLKVHVSDDVIKQSAVAIEVYCSYRDRERADTEKNCSDSLTLTLYSKANFKKIKDLFVVGDAVPLDSVAFSGRKPFINNILSGIKKNPGKQVIIYGQKRSGKSSVLERLYDQLLKDGEYYCVKFSLGDISKNISEYTFYHKILNTIETDLKRKKRKNETVPDFPFIGTVQDFQNRDTFNPANTFKNIIIDFMNLCEMTEGWKSKKIVLMIDEFTYIYSGIKNGTIDESIMKQWKAVTQNNESKLSVVLVGQDVVPSFRQEPYAANAFAIIEDIRLTYLDKIDAIELITKPMLAGYDEGEENNPYIGNAIEKILEYTSCNPFYIQIMCSKLVTYINEHKLKRVTEADVDDLANLLLDPRKPQYYQNPDRFENLINPGEEENTDEYIAYKNDILSVLKNIAKVTKARNYDYCSRNDINVIEDKQREELILKELTDREVLEQRDKGYKIQVKLFREWLLR